MALTAVVQGLFILVVVLLYSGMVWKSLDQYFRDEFKKHLEQDKHYKQFREQNEVDVIKEESQIEMFNSNLEIGGLDSELDEEEGCRKENQPSIKYKKEGSVDKYSDEVCPFTPP